MRNDRLGEAQGGIKITRRNINNLRYTDDTTLMEESQKELKSLLMKVKEESEKAGLKLSIQRSRHLIPSLHGKWMGKQMKKVTDFLFWRGLGGMGSKITITMTLKGAYSLEEKL